MTHIYLQATGSTLWDHPGSVQAVMRHYTREAHSLGLRLLVRQGGAKGADSLVQWWVASSVKRGWPVDTRTYPANWSAPCVPECRPDHRQSRGGREWCPFAGFRRNQQMVDEQPRAEVCVGFWRNGSSGTRDCLKRATEAGMRTFPVRWADRELAMQSDWLYEHAPRLVVPA